jgi:hypothetical protein
MARIANRGVLVGTAAQCIRALAARTLRFAVGLLVAATLTLASGGVALAEGTGAAADDLRTGWYNDEPLITPALVKSGGFAQVFKAALQGQIYAQPLTADGTVFVATEDNFAYGLDPLTGAVRWERSFGTPLNALEKPIECTNLQPHIGITGTPVIDNATHIAYFVSGRYVNGSSGAAAWYMHAVELNNHGREQPGFPVEIAGEARNLPGVKFAAIQHLQRPGLLELNGVVYAAFGSNCDKETYQGWIVGVSASEHRITTMWATSSEGGSIWQSGGALISDGPGQILLSTGNGGGTPGEHDPPKGPGGKPPEGHLGESVVRVEVQSEGNLKATDFFSPFNNAELDEEDLDVGSAAPIALPHPYFGTAATPNLLVQEGKKGYVYLLNREHLGGMGEGPEGKDEVVQTVGRYGGVWDGSAVWPGDGGYVFIPSTGVGDEHLNFFKYAIGNEGRPTLSLAASNSGTLGYGSGSPIVTSNLAASGSAILWITRCQHTTCKEASLRAYNPVPASKEPTDFWETAIGSANKFSRPDASNGHIYVANAEGDVYGFSGPVLSPSTKSLPLGTAPVGAKLSAEVTFTNTGTPLKVSAVQQPAAPFAASGLPAVGSEIQPGQVITVPVTFTSSEPGGYAGSLSLTTQAGTTVVSLSATATSFILYTPPPEVITGQIPPPGGSPTLVGAGEAPVALTALRVRFLASKHGLRRREISVSYALSAAATVELRVQRRVYDHRCQSGVRTCVHYRSTAVKHQVDGRTGDNVLTLNLARLPAGAYRLLARLIGTSGVPGIARYIQFTLAR